MKRLLAILIPLMLIVAVAIGEPKTRPTWIACGAGVFRVAVCVNDGATTNPVRGAKLILKDSGADELASIPDSKRLLRMLEPRVTGEFGDAFVYYYGGSSDRSDEAGNWKHIQEVRGILIVECDGFETQEIDLVKLFGQAYGSANSIPLVEVGLKRKSK